MDFEDPLIKEILKMNDIQIYLEEIPDDSIREIEIHISSKEDKFVNKIEDNKVTKIKKIKDKKITVIFNFWKYYDENLNKQILEKAIKHSDEILKNISMLFKK